jgi:hypothetical protein
LSTLVDSGSVLIQAFTPHFHDLISVFVLRLWAAMVVAFSIVRPMKCRRSFQNKVGDTVGFMDVETIPNVRWRRVPYHYAALLFLFGHHNQQAVN